MHIHFCIIIIIDMIERNIEQIVEKGNQQLKKGDVVRKLIVRGCLIANLSPLNPLNRLIYKMVTALLIKFHEILVL